MIGNLLPTRVDAGKSFLVISKFYYDPMHQRVWEEGNLHGLEGVQDKSFFINENLLQVDQKRLIELHDSNSSLHIEDILQVRK